MVVFTVGIISALKWSEDSENTGIFTPEMENILQLWSAMLAATQALSCQNFHKVGCSFCRVEDPGHFTGQRFWCVILMREPNFGFH